jgi:ribosomal-protein-alanine N-acetyltransferase
VVRVITIRPFTPADVPGAVALEESAGFGTWSEKVFRDELAAENRIYLVADDGHRLAGFGGVMVVGEEAHVTNLLVALERRRQGVAGRLLSGLVRRAVEFGARHITLEVRSRNAAARALYGKLGLVPVGVRRGFYGDDDALILWAHDIDHPEFLEGLG